MPNQRPATLAELKLTDYRYMSVKDELRKNLIAKLRANETIFPGILGYRESVIPQAINGILARHDMLFLGLRGQAKTRMLRLLPTLLDEWIPTLAGVDINDDPLVPVTRTGRRIVAEQGGAAVIEWVHRNDRYQEKLATPDVTIADLIGEIDLVKHAEGRYLSDETTMHYGLIPRANRGLFAINELPDLAPRIQVGLFNVLEERDIQIRCYPVRLNLDVCLVFSANPEDYTNRGRIVTPLKDRIGTVVRTHYPETTAEALQIVKENAWLERGAADSPSGVDVMMPTFMAEIIEDVVRLARVSPHVSQASGVSVRTSIANAEAVVSNAERRGILSGEDRVVVRIADLQHLAASSRGKIEMSLADDDASEDKLVQSLIGEAVKGVFNKVSKGMDFDNVIEEFQGNVTFPAGDDIGADEFVANIKAIKPLHQAATQLRKALQLDDTSGSHAAAGEFVLEGLYVNNRLSKFNTRGKTFFKK